MKHRRAPGVIDIFEVTDPKEIKVVANDPKIDRFFDTRTCPVNRFILKRALNALSFRGRRFPTMTPRGSSERQAHQQELWASLSAKAVQIKTGPEELEPLASWVAGIGPYTEVGVLTQQLLGSLFCKKFVATPESWAAAEVLVTAPRSRNLPRMFWWLLTGKLNRAKHLLTGMVDGDLSAVNAIGIASHNIVKGLRHMRALYSDVSVRSSLSAETTANQCLFAPVSVYRQATAPGELSGCRFERNSLFILAIGEASQRVEGDSLVFMDDSWSRCPAAKWVPAMLEGVWSRATKQDRDTPEGALLQHSNG